MKDINFSRLLYVFLLISLITIATAVAQDGFPWPVTPFNQSQLITGTFSEYRSTSANGHFHNGTDIPKSDGSPVYPVKDGVVRSLATEGSNAYVRVDDKAYVHIRPNPNLGIGDFVYASETVLGNIISGQGHVHFTNGYVGSERNSMLTNDGLQPLDDPWAPIIRFIRFYENNTANEIPADNLFGRVDIMVKVDEQNGPPSYPTSVRNNGTYKIGYKIYNEDTSTVVYEPPNNGLRFQFDTKPSNSYVNITFFRPLSSTTSHVYQVTNEISQDNYWDTTVLPIGNYVVMAFTEDTRQNTDTMYVPVTLKEVDKIPPAQPNFKYVIGTETEMRLGWFPNQEDDLAGYRLYFSFDNENWTLFKDENVFTSGVTDTVLNQALNSDVYFKLTAVDQSPLINESNASDVYGLSNGSSFLGKVLVVDGFDRSDGAWTQSFHSFSYIYGRAIILNEFSFDTVPNESVEDSIVNLNEYEAVLWFLGDETTKNATFSEKEQVVVKKYLENGGNLFVNGSKIAYDLDPDGNMYATIEDEQFLHQYLKADYVTQGSGIQTAVGNNFSIFNQMTLNFGQTPYQLDSIDVIVPNGDNVTTVFEYDETQAGGVLYEGTFGSSSVPGKLIYCAFPFETVEGDSVRNEFISRIMNFFFETTSISDGSSNNNYSPTQFELQQNYPNPFNPKTTIGYQVPVSSNVQLEIYNSLGQKIRTLVNHQLSAGKYYVDWNGRNDSGNEVSSGIYIVKFTAEGINSTGNSYQKIRKILFTK